MGDQVNHLQTVENDRPCRQEATRQAEARPLGRVSDAKKLAGVIARVSTLGDREKTLQLIADGTLDALGCDAVALYSYDQNRDKLDDSPKTAGLYFLITKLVCERLSLPLAEARVRRRCSGGET